MKSRFKVVGLLSVFLMLFALGGVASADNAASISVAISYPCAQGEECDETGVAVSRSFGPSNAGPGDDVNIYITLLDAGGNPATAGPNGESLTTLTARITSQRGNVIVPGAFLQSGTEATVAFNGDSAARAYVDYTDAEPGLDSINVDITGANPLIGQANVNVVAPDATALAVRTLDGDDAPSEIFEAVSPPNANGGNPATAGDSVTVTVIPHDQGLYTPAPNLVGRQVTVNAYADFNDNGTVGDVDEEKTPIATATGSFASPIDLNLQINNAGPDGLIVVFTATAEDANGDTIETPQVGSTSTVEYGVNFLVDTVEMVSDDPVAIMVGLDPFGNGNLIEMPEGDCVKVLDDNDGNGCSGTASEEILLVLVDELGNATNGTATISGNLEGILEEQLAGCGTIPIPGDYGDYAGSCTLSDDNSAEAGSIVIGPLDFSATGLTGDSVSVYLLPAMACGELDMVVSVPQETIDAGDTVRLTIEGSVVAAGNTLEITAFSAANGPQLLSSGDYSTATFTLEAQAIDLDSEAAGIQIDVAFFGPSTTTLAEEVLITVKNKVQCDAAATTAVGISDIEPGDPANLAVVALAADIESDSTLDAVGAYEGTSPIVIDSYILADGATYTTIVDSDNGCCDLQVWDGFTNVVTCQPTITCSTDSGNALPVVVSECDVAVAFTSGAAGTSVTLTCGVDTNNDQVNDVTRTFLLSNIVTEIPENGGPVEPDDDATALAVLKEGPQDVNGNQINPQPGGEAIIRISANGVLDTNVNVRIDFAEGSVAGAELRNLSGTKVTLPVTITLPAGPLDKRYVVYAPATGQVTVTATETSATGLEAASQVIVFGEACVVSISPPTASVATGTTQQFSASTTCDGVVQALAATPAYTWAITASDCTSSGSISETGLYEAPDAGDCTETITATDTANGNASAEATVTVISCADNPVVTITPGSPACVAQEFCAATTLCGQPVEGTYTWSVTGGTANTTSGECINFTPAGTGSFTVRATDTANGSVQASVSGTCVTTAIEATFTGCGGRFFTSFGIVTIEGTDTDLKLTSIVKYDYPLIIKLPKLLNRQEQKITQFVLLLPDIICPGWMYPATVTVTVDGLSDTFVIPACGG